MNAFEETKCNNSLATDYVITSGYKVLFGESRQLSLPLTKVPNIERPGYLVVLNEGAERYAELHREVLDGYDYEYDDRYVYWLSGRYALERPYSNNHQKNHSWTTRRLNLLRMGCYTDHAQLR